MSDTPRTDLMVARAPIGLRTNAAFEQSCDLCRQLERELNAANERINRLEDALNGTVNWIVELAESGDAGFWDAETVPPIIAARAALKAMEAK
jgi:hypothetical protein